MMAPKCHVNPERDIFVRSSAEAPKILDVPSEAVQEYIYYSSARPSGRWALPDVRVIQHAPSPSRPRGVRSSTKYPGQVHD